MYKNKMQREVARLRKELPSLGSAYDYDNIDWGELELDMIDWYYYNDSFNIKGALRETFENTVISLELMSYKGYLVERYIECKSRMISVNSFPRQYIREVAQRWIKDDKEVTYIRSVMEHSKLDDYYIFFNGRMRMAENNNVPDIESCHACVTFNKGAEEALVNSRRIYREIYKKCKNIEFIKKLYFGKYYNTTTAEYLAKTSRRMYNYYLSNGSRSAYEINEFLDVVKFAHRHSFKPRNIERWFKHLHNIKTLELDLHSPKYVFVDSIKMYKVYERRAERKRVEMETKKKMEQLINDIKNQKVPYRERMAKYLNITFTTTDGSVIFKVLQNEMEFVQEGIRMHNCIGGYWREDKLNSLCMVAIDTKTQEHIGNIEISLKDFKINQCYGVCNKETPICETLRLTINKNMDLIKSA